MKWYEKGWVIFLLLLFVFPVGVFLLWKYGHWRKSRKIIATVIFAFIFLGAFLGDTSETKTDIPTEANVETMSEPEQDEKKESTEPVENLESETTQEPTEVLTPEEPTETEEPQLEVEHRTGDDFVGISDKDISETSISSIARKVPNDITDNTYCATLTDDIDIEEYALSYYQKYFQSDKEIHCIVNFYRNTTTVFNCYGDGRIYLTIRDHIKNEENDAKTLGRGTKLGQYCIYVDNGDIEKLQ